MEVKIVVDNTDKVLKDLDRKCQAALEACGIQAVSHAQANITEAVPRHSGSWYTPKMGSGLRGSISHQVEDDTCYVGTNQEYAIYNEYGTGKFAEGGKGRKGWWVYVPGSKVKGKNSGKIYTYEQAAWIVARMKEDGIDAHMTQGIKPIHFLKNAIANNIEQYKKIIEQELNK